MIVDDGSRDGTAAVAAGLAAADARIRVVTHAHNRGIAAARNAGLAATTPTSRYVAFLDYDDVWMPDTLAVLRAALATRAGTSAAAHGIADCIDDDGRTVPRPDVAQAQQTRLASWPAGASPCGRRSTDRARQPRLPELRRLRRLWVDPPRLPRFRVGGFDPRAVPADDYDMWLRLYSPGRHRLRAARRVALPPARRRTSLRPHPPRGRGAPYVRYKLATAAENTPAQRRLVTTAFRAFQRDLLRERLSALVAAARRRDPASALRELAAAGVRAAGFARGRPWSWHK